MGGGCQGGICFASFISRLIFFRGWELGMCESVRTRNTLYEVGAAKSMIWHNAVERREDEKERKKRKTIKYIKYAKYRIIKILVFYKILENYNI